MSDRPDIMGRLQTYADERFFARPLIFDAMAEIERLRATPLSPEAVEALRELADAAEHDMTANRDEDPGGWWSLRTENAIRAARAALSAAALAESRQPVPSPSLEAMNRRPSASPEALEAARRIMLARVDEFDSIFEQDAVAVARALLSLSAPEDRA